MTEISERSDSKRSPLSPAVWWEVTSGPITRVISISLSKQLLCPCRIDLAWHCQVGSAVSCQPGIQAFLTGVHHMAQAPLQGPDPSSSRTHVVWPAAISTEAACPWTQKLILTACDRGCVCVSVFMQMRFMTLFVTLLGWHKALTFWSLSFTTCD